MFLSDVSIKRPVFATMMMVALVVLGVVAYGRLAIDEYPDVSYPIVNVQTPYPGASPEVVEREVSRPIEEALNTVQGLEEVTSTSREGSGWLWGPLKTTARECGWRARKSSAFRAGEPWRTGPRTRTCRPCGGQ